LKLVDSIRTQSAIVSTQLVKVKDKYFAYIGGEGKSLESLEVNTDGQLQPLKSYVLSQKFGGIRGLISTTINNAPSLIVGNKAEDAIEIHQINEQGVLQKISEVRNSDSTFLKQNITTHLIEIANQKFLFVGGLDAGLSCFKLSEDATCSHVQSMKDTDDLFLDGIIGMASLNIKEKYFLFTGGFVDGGVSCFEVFNDGTFRNTDNIIDNDTLFLNGAFPVEAVQLSGNNYVLIGHRHKAHYPAYKDEKGLAYHGDGVNVFKINGEGKFIDVNTFKDNDDLKLKGSTRIEIIKLNEKKALVFIATRDDTGIQVCALDSAGQLSPIYKMDLGYSVYNGMTVKNIEDHWYLLAGGYDQKVFNTYRIDISAD